MMTWRSMCIMALGVAFAAPACGGSSDAGGTTDDGRSTSGAACSTFIACGGTIVPGKYKITSTCMQPILAESSGWCSEQAVLESEITGSGTFTFAEGNRYASSMAFTSNKTVLVPESCLADSGMTCGDLESSPQTTLTCSGDSSCTCSLATAWPNLVETGVYALLEKSFIRKPDGGAPADPDEFCVFGNTIHVGVRIGDVGLGYIVLTRQ